MQNGRMDRVQKQAILKDLDKKMVLVAGPRQAGKTWLAKDIAKNFKHALYLNYDQIAHRDVIHHQDWRENNEIVIFDELHKMPNWKNYLKGVYDTKPSHMRLLITGSARLEIYRHVGDSLAGRYFIHHLLPLSPAELAQLNQSVDLDHFLKRSGFPEPFLAENEIEADRWRKQYIESLLTTDVFEYGSIQNIKAMRLVFELLRRRVGSPISYQSLAEDIAVSSNTIKKYIEILEALYIVFRVSPFSKNIARSILKEPKIYFFDVGLVLGNEGKRLENFVAVCLLKHIYGKYDCLAEEYSLHYLRTKEMHEVDFALVKGDQIAQVIEVKLSNHEINKSLLYFKKKYNFQAIQVVKELKQERLKLGIDIIKVLHFLQSLYL